MARKNTWLPGQPGSGSGRNSDEPGWASDRRSWRRWAGPARTPLGEVLAAALLVIVAAALGLWAFTRATPLNLGAFLIASIAIVIMVVVAVYYAQHGIRRWIWRRKHIALTGGRYLRAWERTPPIAR